MILFIAAATATPGCEELNGAIAKEGGTIASLMVNSCLINMTEFRTKELSQLLADN